VNGHPSSSATAAVACDTPAIVPTRKERDTRKRFAERYGAESSEVVKGIERAVIGGDWGANGYTTMAEADRLGALLELRPGAALLDLGAGRGWPGLYLAARTGCRATLIDVPVEGLRSAVVRAGAENLSDRVTVVAASARHLPFRAGVFDAVIHTDVLC
jgi:SAM-dependent methyltransferase